jgi:G:T-mismatch repair DNA endonuclease (very short patch repair protein)
MNSANVANRKCKPCAQSGISKKPKKSRGSVFQKEFWIKKGLSEEAAIQRVKEIQSKSSSKKSFESRSKIANETSPYKIETWLKKGFSEEHAKFEVNSRRKTNVEFWQKKGFSLEESLAKLSESQTIAAKNSKPKDCVPTQLKYWLKKGYNEVEAKKMLSERQATFTLDKCIARYGEEEGKKKFEERQIKWKSAVFNDLQWIGGGKSKISSQLFDNLEEPGALTGGSERFIRNNDTVYKYDFCIKSTKKIIEFNGDFWHCHPSTYSSDFYHPIKKMTAQEIWNYDTSKEELARSKGYDYLIVWESEYKLFPEETINKCKEFLCS